MDNTTSQWPQGLEQVEPRPISDQRRPRPQKEQVVHCQRCNSTNTKFCYYNNYSLSQPRYFCKACRRYWTEGGTLRNVPVGGGSRKNKRSSSSISSQISPPSSKKLVDHATSASIAQCVQSPRTYQGQDLNLGYPPMTTYDQYNKTMELLKNGSVPSMGLNSLIFPMPRPGSNPIFPSEFSFQEYKTIPNFSLNGVDQNGFANFHNVEETTPRLFFPFEDLKQAPKPSDLEQNRGQGEVNGYWSGMLNEGSW